MIIQSGNGRVIVRFIPRLGAIDIDIDMPEYQIDYIEICF